MWSQSITILNPYDATIDSILSEAETEGSTGEKSEPKYTPKE